MTEKRRKGNKVILVLSILDALTWLLGMGCSPKESARTPPPVFSVFYTCDTRGHIEPCGCASGMAGGLSRRQTYLREDLPRDYLLVDAGDVTAGAREWERLELEYILKGYHQMGYHAVNLGIRELSLTAGQLVEMKTRFGGLVSANVMGPEGNPICQPYVVVELSNGYRCGITGIVDDRLEADQIGTDLRVKSPAEALTRIIPELKQKVEYLVLLAFADETQMKALAQQFFELDLIVGGQVQKASADPIRENRSAIVFNTDKGKAVGRLDVISREGSWDLRNRFRTLEEDMTPDPQIVTLMEDYKQQLRTRDFRPVKDDVDGLSSISARRSKTANRYVGPATCKECHPASYDTWLHSKHAHAFATLEEKGHQYNPRCLKCHTVGYMASDGYINQRLTPDLLNVSCESCHGRGHYHNKAMAQETPPAKPVLMKLTKCLTCHDEDNSPEFEEEKYWEEIAHDQL